MRTRGGRGYDRAGVYKISKDRMSIMTDEFSNVRVYMNRVQKCTILTSKGHMRASKSSIYESPYTIIGSIKYAGSERSPKDI